MRSLPDRRKAPTPFLSRYSFSGGRRRTVRRDEDRDTYVFVDRYSPRLLLILVAIILLSVIDGLLTLALVQDQVVREANPLMAFFLERGSTPFVMVKFLVTAACLIIFCLFKNFRVSRVGLVSTLLIYFLVVLYELKILLLHSPVLW